MVNYEYALCSNCGLGHKISNIFTKIYPNGVTLILCKKCAKKLAREILDEFPENEEIVLPCAIGTDVFFIYEVYDEAGNKPFVIGNGSVVGFFSIQDDITIEIDGCGLSFWYKAEDIGKSVFFTKEDAEKTMKEREHND